MTIELLISDLDGTILETEDYHRLAYNALFQELRIEKSWSKQDYGPLQTMGGSKLEEVFSWMNLPDEKFQETKKKLYRRKTELYVELITNDLPLRASIREGIERFFQEVRCAGIPIAMEQLAWAGLPRGRWRQPWVKLS